MSQKEQFFKRKTDLYMLICARRGELLFNSMKEKSEPPPLITAVRRNDESEVIKLLSEGVTPNVVDSYGFTPLFWGIARRNPAIVRMLIEKGADVHARNSFGETPLMVASFMAMYEAVRLMIEKGAVVDARNNYGMTSLMCAAQSDSPENEAIAVARLLLKNGADPSLQDRMKLTASDYARYMGHHRMLRYLYHFLIFFDST